MVERRLTGENEILGEKRHFVHHKSYTGWNGVELESPRWVVCDWTDLRHGHSGPVVIICTTSLTLTNSTFCPHSVFMCFVWIWEQTAIISLYSINWLVFITETECVYCAVRTGSLYIILRSVHTVYLSLLPCMWIWEQTAIISLYSFNWLVFITETESVYCAVRTGSLCIILLKLSGYGIIGIR